jgi:VCBS repeat-containing protein
MEAPRLIKQLSRHLSVQELLVKVELVVVLEEAAVVLEEEGVDKMMVTVAAEVGLMMAVEEDQTMAVEEAKMAAQVMDLIVAQGQDRDEATVAVTVAGGRTTTKVAGVETGAPVALEGMEAEEQIGVVVGLHFLIRVQAS